MGTALLAHMGSSIQSWAGGGGVGEGGKGLGRGTQVRELLDGTTRSLHRWKGRKDCLLLSWGVWDGGVN